MTKTLHSILNSVDENRLRSLATQLGAQPLPNAKKKGLVQLVKRVSNSVEEVRDAAALLRFDFSADLDELVKMEEDPMTEENTAEAQKEKKAKISTYENDERPAFRNTHIPVDPDYEQEEGGVPAMYALQGTISVTPAGGEYTPRGDAAKDRWAMIRDSGSCMEVMEKALADQRFTLPLMRDDIRRAICAGRINVKVGRSNIAAGEKGRKSEDEEVA